MATGLRVEDRLDGQVNFGAWKERIIIVLDEAEVWDIVEKTVAIPKDATQLAAYKKKCAKARTLILDGIKDHAFEVWEALTKLYQTFNENRTCLLETK